MTNPPRPLTPNFERQRCAYNARQLDDLNKSESERRAESLAYDKAKRRGEPSRTPERFSRMIHEQANAPHLKPSPRLSRGADQACFDKALANDDREARRLTFMATRMAARREEARSRSRSTANRFSHDEE